MISEIILYLWRPTSIYVTRSGGKMFQEYFGIQYVTTNNNQQQTTNNNNNNMAQGSSPQVVFSTGGEFILTFPNFVYNVTECPADGAATIIAATPRAA